MRTLLDLSRKEARRFFLKPKSYFSLDLPSYYQFDRILNRVRESLHEQSLQTFYHSIYHPRFLIDVNCPIVCNKDGKYAWRKQQIIHPFFYVELVRLLTQADVWDRIRSRAKSLRTPKITCSSMVLAPTRRLTRNEQDIFNWAGNFTHETIRKSLEYKYMLTTDLTSCYDSLSTYLIAWALHGRQTSYDPSLVGWQIIEVLQDMSFGQTCGLPQGSVLMDFLAEIVLSYIDCAICGRLAEFSDVQILRYRDDYRIFANRLDVAENVMRIMVETLTSFNLKINLSKTHLTTNTIRDALKPDRLAWKNLEPVIFGEKCPSLFKRLLLIKEFGDHFTNCGSIRSALSALYVNEINSSNCHEDVWQIASVMADIMYNHPSSWPQCTAILSKYLGEHDATVASQIIQYIQKKFADIPNTEYLDIWLQRLSVKHDPCKHYRSPMCQIIYDSSARLWNSDWLKLDTDLCDSDIVSFAEIMEMPRAIPVNEVALFTTNHGSGGGG